MSKKETAKRYVLFIISLFFSALGVAFTKHGELGVSPISSVANVLSCTKGGWSGSIAKAMLSVASLFPYPYPHPVGVLAKLE